MRLDGPRRMTPQVVEQSTVAVFACAAALLVLAGAYRTANRPACRGLSERCSPSTGLAGSQGEPGSRCGIVARSSRWLLPAPEPVDAALQVPGLSRGDSFVVFNGNAASASQAEILDVAVMVRLPAPPR